LIWFNIYLIDYLFQYLLKKELSYDNKNLNVPSLRWIGLKLSDLDMFSLDKKEEYLLSLNERDLTIAKGLKKKFNLLHEYELLNEVN
jgi:hypothetical protein